MAARLSPLETRALGALARAVRARFGERVRAVTLFGSRARGEGRDDSDLDVLVLVDGLRRAERLIISDLAFDIGLEHHLVLSPLAEDAARWRTDLPLASAVAREGVPL